ncbi:hypothetical protein C8R43DRAFT_1242666 [Mycena crocata]|nr:hypothetical protein C8R43DRAFT_1242666 [Mycena crocata]
MDSILKQLRTGYIPTQSEAENIQKDLISLQEEYGRLDALIRELTAQRDLVKEAMQSKQALISPIRRLPDDIIQEIFLAGLPTHHNAIMSAHEAPLLLCRVCSVWRVLALATPRLWASLHVHLGFLLQNDDRALAATQWVKRSAACPLSVSICGIPAGHFGVAMVEETSNGILVTDPAQKIVKALLRSAPRWRAVALSDLPGPYLGQLRTASMPLLKTIRIMGDQHLAQWLDVFTAPSVRQVDLDLIVVKEDASILIPRLSHITHLSMSSRPWPGIPGNVAVSILTTLTQLVSLKMFIRDILSIPDGITHLPFLKSLELRTAEGPLPLVLADLLDHLFMPQLGHLAVDSGYVAESPLFAALTERSPLIDSLEISFHTFTQEALRETLLSFRSVVKLTVLNTAGWHPNHPAPPDTEYLLTLLTNEAQTLLPSLRALESKYGVDVPDETLFEFLQSRVDTGVPFRLRIDYPSGRHFPDVEGFRSQGVEVELTQMSTGWLPPGPPLTPWSGLLPIE